MFKDRILKNCPFCDGKLTINRIVYSMPPKGEISFNGVDARNYQRSYHICQLCGHFVSSLEVGTKKMYKGSYVTSNYGNLQGLHQNFLRIQAFPPKKSDNFGRVKRVSAFTRKFFGAVDIISNTVLDIGSGLGVFPYAMKKIGFVCTALDPDPIAVKHLTDYLEIPAVHSTFDDTLDIGKFDIITLNKVVEHANDAVAMLSNCHLYLKEHGMVYVEVPDGESALAESAEREEFFIDHIHVFSKASLVALCIKAGFKILSIERLREPSKKFILYAFIQTNKAQENHI